MPATFSGTVVAEALHAGGRSLIFEWSRESILTRQHMFVEIVHSAANIALLKTFNAERYATLAIAMGQTNEIIAQVGQADQERDRPVRRRTASSAMTLMGTSASSGTVRTYLADHADLRMPGGGPIFDGFLLTSTNGNTPLPIVDVPMIQMPTQTEVVTWAEMGIAYRRPDSDEPGNRFRLYEVAGMPHNNSRDSPAFATIRARCRSPISRPARSPRWPESPDRVDHATARRRRTRRRSPWIRTPPTTARTWRSMSTATPRAASATSGWTCRSRPTAYSARARPRRRIGCASWPAPKVPLPDATLRKLYRDKATMPTQVNSRLKELVAQGWFLPEYVDMVRRDAAAAPLP